MRVSPFATAVSVEDGTKILDKSATIPVVATRQAYLMVAGRGRSCRKLNLAVLAGRSEPWFESRSTSMRKHIDDEAASSKILDLTVNN